MLSNHMGHTPSAYIDYNHPVFPLYGIGSLCADLKKRTGYNVIRPLLILVKLV
jgi:hypothetical protein